MSAAFWVNASDRRYAYAADLNAAVYLFKSTKYFSTGRTGQSVNNSIVS